MSKANGGGGLCLVYLECGLHVGLMAMAIPRLGDKRVVTMQGVA
jgi:hypothetical protein